MSMTVTMARTSPADRPVDGSSAVEGAGVGLAINLLGRPSIVRDGAEVPPPRGRKVWALLAYLLLAGAPPTRSRLAELLFAGADDPLAALRWNLVELRRLLGPEAAVGGEPVRLELPPDATVDLRLLTSGTWVEAKGVPGLDRELLEGIEIVGSSIFETWLLAERRRFTGLSAAVLREAATARLAAGDAPAAIGLATRLVALDEFDEEAHALLVRACSAAGDTAGARRHLAGAVDLLRRELGVEPSATLLGAADPAAASPAAAPVRGAAAARALLEAGEAAIGAGAVEPGLESLRRAVAEARQAADPGLECRALLAIGSAYVHAVRGRDGEGATALHAALTLAERVGARDLAATAERELGYVELLRGRYDGARARLARAVEHADAGVERAWGLAIAGAARSDQGHTAPALELLSGAIATAAADGSDGFDGAAGADGSHAAGGADGADARRGSDGAAGADARRLEAWAAAFLGRTHFLRDELPAARAALGRSIELARSMAWISFLPWPQSLLGQVDLAEGRRGDAAAAFESAFAMGCQLGDPCWEGMAARGIGLLHIADGDIAGGIEWLDDARTRCVRLPDAYLWIQAYCLDALCAAGVGHGRPEAPRWIADLEALAARTGMREVLVRALLHRSALGDAEAGQAARLFASEIDNPAILGHLGGLAPGPGDGPKPRSA